MRMSLAFFVLVLAACDVVKVQCVEGTQDLSIALYDADADPNEALSRPRLVAVCEDGEWVLERSTL